VAALHDRGDVALDFLESHEPVIFTKEEERIVIRRIDMVLMPLVGLHVTVRFGAYVLTNASIDGCFIYHSIHG
jgi:hypothetical protein